MDLDPEIYEPIIIIERAKYALMNVTEYNALSAYWQGWITIAHAASARANKQRASE